LIAERQNGCGHDAIDDFCARLDCKEIYGDREKQLSDEAGR
jgi:hypothetical protein